MKQRFYLGLSLLAALLALGVGTILGMKTIHQPAETALAQAAELALDGSMEQAVSLATDAYSRWQKYRSLTASVADHGPMDDTEMLFQEMLVYANAEEIPHFAACCAQLSTMVKAMYDAHSPSVWNLL